MGLAVWPELDLRGFGWLDSAQLKRLTVEGRPAVAPEARLVVAELAGRRLAVELVVSVAAAE